MQLSVALNLDRGRKKCWMLNEQEKLLCLGGILMRYQYALGLG